MVQRTTDTGAVTSSRLYDAWGLKKQAWDNDLPNVTKAQYGYLADDPYNGFGAQFGYQTGQRTQMVHCTYRDYDPFVGRWINRDPAGYGGGINLYAYCNNNPIMGVDPSGLATDPGGSNNTIRYSFAAFIPYAEAWGYKGDGPRGASANDKRYRIQQTIIFDVKSQTVQFVKSHSKTVRIRDGATWEVSNNTMSATSCKTANGTLQVTLHASAGNPGLHGLSPAIRYDLTFSFDPKGNLRSIQGTRSQYPGFELFRYENGKNPKNLFQKSTGMTFSIPEQQAG